MTFHMATTSIWTLLALGVTAMVCEGWTPLLKKVARHAARLSGADFVKSLVHFRDDMGQVENISFHDRRRAQRARKSM